mgnify:CR=1 FL=1
MSREQNYSPLDRAIHRIAFSSRAIQLSAADIEHALYSRQYRDIPTDNPVFITSLPRAGTTLLLEIFSRIPGFATHRYRDMPFILAPLLWKRISGRFRKQASLKERAHADGMQVGYDSPEAFEEVLWCAHWPKKYRKDCILTWNTDDTAPGFRDLFIGHMQKIIALRAMDQPGVDRYASKNNANIARIGLLKRLFPKAHILVPFRQPVDHAASMHRQHMNFLSRHVEDPFSKRYMHDIGHFEFGSLHRPIHFNSRIDPASRGQPDTLDYWLAYWIDTYEHIMQQQEHVMLLSYEYACNHGNATLEVFGSLIDPGFSKPPQGLAEIFHSPPGYNMESVIRDSKLLERALALHERLLEMSIVKPG